MCDYFLIADMAGQGEDEGKKPIEDKPEVKSTWEKGKSSCPRRRRRVIMPGPSALTFTLPVGLQQPTNTTSVVKKRKIKNIWTGPCHCYVDVKGLRPKVRKRHVPTPRTPCIESDNLEDKPSEMEIDEETYKDEDSSSDYDPATTPLTYVYRNPLDDMVYEDFGDIGWDSPKDYTMSLDSGPPNFGTSSDDDEW
jgi:hypothetical protein